METELLYIAKIKKLSDSNNVIVTFMDGRTMMIGKKQLVLRLERLAGLFSQGDYPNTLSSACINAQEARAQLWPKTL